MTKLYEATNHILIDTDMLKPIGHSHMAAHIIVSVNGKIHVTSENAEYECQGILIPSGASHVVDTRGERVLVFLYDNTTNVAMQIKWIQSLSIEICNAILDSYSEFCSDGSSHAYKIFENCVLQKLGLDTGICAITDERILSAIEYMHKMSSERLTCKMVADEVHLSEGRFSHLFKEQVGMTFSAYLIYQRILYVYAKIIQGTSITEAAIEAGFSSSAHFADVNRRVFGLTASDMIQDLIFVKV